MTPENKLYTPYEVLHTISSKSIQPFEKDRISIYGQYIRKKGNGYNGVYYDRIRDESSNGQLTIKIHESIRDKLTTDSCYEFEGIIERKIINQNDELNIYLTFNVLQLKAEKLPIVNIKRDLRANILKAREVKGSKNIDDLINEIFSKNGKPRVALISSENSETKPDVYDSIGRFYKYYQLQDVEINLLNKNQIIQKLKEIDEQRIFDLLVLYRGGGNLSVFEDIELAQTVLNTKTPILTALGHRDDQPLVHLIADQGFITPTAIGTYFKNLVEKFEKQGELKTEINELKKELETSKHRLNEELNSKRSNDTQLQAILATTTSTNKDLQIQLNKMTSQNEMFKNEIEKLKSQENTSPNLEEIRNYKPFIVLSSLASLIVGILISLGLVFGYQLFFPAKNPANNSLQQKQSLKEGSIVNTNESSNANTSSVQNRKVNRSK